MGMGASGMRKVRDWGGGGQSLVAAFLLGHRRVLPVLWRRTAAHAAWIPSTTRLDSLQPKHSCTVLVNLLCEVCGPLRITYGMLVGLEKVEKVVQTQAGEAGAVYGEGLEVD